MAKEAKDKVSQRRSQFLDFLCEWQKDNEKVYAQIRKGFEAIEKDDYSTYIRLFEMCQSCIPNFYLAKCMNIFGLKTDGLEYSVEEKANLNALIREFFEFDGYIKFGFVEGEFIVDKVKEKDESENPNIFYIRVMGINEWWRSIPIQLRYAAIGMFHNIKENELKKRMRRIYIGAFACVPFFIDNVCTLAYEKKDELLLGGVYYIMLDHGLRNITQQFGGILSSGYAYDTVLQTIIHCAVNKMVGESITHGFDKKSDWKKHFKSCRNQDLRREIMATVESAKGKKGRPRTEQESYNLDDMLIGNKETLKTEILSCITGMEHDYEIAYIYEALRRSEHIEDVSFPAFYHAICRHTGKDYDYDTSSRLASFIHSNKQEFETSASSKYQRGRRNIHYLTEQFKDQFYKI